VNFDAGGLSILLADSDAYLAEVSAKFLGALGARVTVVTDGGLVGRELERSTFSALVASTNLSRTSGLEVCKQARASMPAIPIVVTGTGTPNERVLALLAGADDYVRRPYSSRDLVERIHVILRRRRSAYPLISSR
jgi:DNA-binding response OmpR family regulator